MTKRKKYIKLEKKWKNPPPLGIGQKVTKEWDARMRRWFYEK